MFSVDGRPTAAVATGVLDLTTGAMAEDWLKWNPHGNGVGFLEDATDQDYARRLAAGVRKKRMLV